MVSSKSLNKFTRPVYLFPFTLVVMVVSQYFLAVPYYVGLYNDDAAYLIKALLFAGVDIVPGDAPFFPGSRNYSAGWPLVLLPFTWLFQLNLSLYRLIAYGCVFLGLCCWLMVADKHLPKGSTPLFALVLLLSGNALQYSGTLMSEPFFFFLVGASAWAWQHRASRAGRFGLPVLLALGWLTRIEGVCLALCFLIWLCWKREWRELLVLAVSTVLLYLLGKSILTFEVIQASQSSSIFTNDFNWLNYAGSWFWAHLHEFASGTFGTAGPVGLASALLMIVLGLWGGGRLFRTSPYMLMLLAVPGALFFWPFFSTRYWFSIQPIWLLGACVVLPRRTVPAILTIVCLLQAWSAVSKTYPQLQPTEQLYQSLSSSPLDSTVVAIHDCRTLIQARRHAITLPVFQSVIELGAYMAANDAEYLVWEAEHSLIRNHLNNPQEQFPRDTALWLVRSGMFKIEFENSAGLIVRLVSAPGDYRRAFEAYRQALQSDSPQTSLAKLKECLSLVPDFPPARLNRIIIEQDLGLVSPAQSAEAFSRYLDQYPHDFQAAVMLSGRFPIEQIRPAVQESYEEAGRLGLVEVQRALGGIL